jgi:hypothetical protein
MSDGRSIRLPSAKFAQVREPGRNGPAVTRSPRVGRGGSNPPLCTMCQRARIGIAACLRNRCLRVRISPLAPIFPTVGNDETLPVLSRHLEPRIDWLAFQSEHTEYALVDSAKRFFMDKTLQGFYSQRKLAKS